MGKHCLYLPTVGFKLGIKVELNSFQKPKLSVGKFTRMLTTSNFCFLQCSLLAVCLLAVRLLAVRLLAGKLFSSAPFGSAPYGSEPFGSPANEYLDFTHFLTYLLGTNEGILM